jgi:hypothetical protein
VAKLLMLFSLLLIACGGVDGQLCCEDGSKSSSSSQVYSSSEGSSSSCTPLDMDLNWQNAPPNSYIHGGTSITMTAYQISKFLITQGQYKTIMGNNPSKGMQRDDLPIEGATWFNAEEFCKKLSVQMCLEPDAIKLPTEAQWEYAAYPQTIIIQRNPEYWEWTNDCFDSEYPIGTHDPSGPSNCPRDFPKVRKGFGNSFDVRNATDPNLEHISGGHISFRVVKKQ